MKSVFTILAFSSLLAIGQLVQAHPGHDHSHWSSEPIHFLTMFAIASLIISGIIYKQCIRRRKKFERKDINHDA
ncbi:hypothetical protein A8139_09255 [Marinomonas primoryensis]|jgi:hypothetical protein|uniref:Uncharacterized protein n=1 Tax=Marinomonas primoryensis TaxID=178399 RepID=A0A2Z4PSP2_9GAMM|nr:hypothetical protein [Marinomonas primoryensis]AWY00159.1 hypothetical protein A8139_09255 [Marinomonas primoryensis]|tara:strand:+ start:425 stop:646 length:222 start_codon:yes stop_codon:yes gene_type:complete